MADFRFEKLDIWRESIDLGSTLFDMAEQAENKKKYKFAEQLNGATLSISNNIAEGSGAASKREFARYLSIARSSLFECVNILHVYEQRGIIEASHRKAVYPQMIQLSKKIYNFKKQLLT